MDKQQIELLKEIEKSGLFDYSNLSADEREILFYLRSKNYISSKPNPAGHGRPCYKITELGKSELYDNKKENVKVILPIVISVVAIVVSIANLVLSILGII